MSSKKKPSKPITEKPDAPRLSRGRTRPGAIFPVAPSAASLPESYAATLQEIKTHLRSARIRAVLAANPIVIEAYWNTGKIILARQQEAAWGAKVIDRLAADLQAEFPDMSGLTRRNLFFMRAFAEAFPDGPIVKQLVSQLPWGQIIRLIQMVKDPAAREFYIRETLAHGWSRSILEIQIQNQIHLRLGKAQNNFALTMPPADSDMAAQLFKDPYLFDFLGTADPRREAEVEQALVDHIQKFLLELGTGFAFVGRQVRLEVGGEDYPLDLLFYCSLIKATKSVLDKLDLENKTASTITAKERRDVRLWSPIALREAVINAIVHNDYTREVPPKFEIFADRIEITSAGSLPDGLTQAEFFEGYSIPRNKELMRIFKDLEMVEHLGSGIPRITRFFPENCFHFTENFLRATLPSIEPVHQDEDAPPQVTPQVTQLLAVFTGEHTRQELQEKLKLIDREHFRKAYLLPALEAGCIVPTQPDKPNSSRQKYRRTT